jgi:hypothetical protein
VEEISRQPSIQTVAWILLAVLSQIYSENEEQKAEKIWKNLQFGQKRMRMCVCVCVCVCISSQGQSIAKEIGIFKKKSRTFSMEQ